jgi:hypothetical protein
MGLRLARPAQAGVAPRQPPERVITGGAGQPGSALRSTEPAREEQIRSAGVIRVKGGSYGCLRASWVSPRREQNIDALPEGRADAGIGRQ